MARRKDFVRRVLFINGRKVGFGRAHKGIYPTKIMLDEIEACYIHGNPWSGFWIAKFSVRIGVDNEGVYAKYNVKAVSQRAAIG